MQEIFERLARESRKSSGEKIVRGIASSEPALLTSLLDWSDGNLSAYDRQFAEGMLATGLLVDVEPSQRRGAIALARKFEQWAADLLLRERLAFLQPAQPLFRKLPKLFDEVRKSGDRPLELVSARRLEDLTGESHIVGYGGKYAVIDRFLPLPTLQVLLAAAGDRSRLYVRLRPDVVYDDRPPDLINEEIIRPIDPGWWRQGRIFRGAPTGLALELQPPQSPADDLQKYWDYHVRGVRRLEMSVLRRGGDYLSVMIEELEEQPDGVLGRCVHSDGPVPVGTCIDDVLANHLDFSINWYPGELGAQRLAARMDKAERVDAEIHMHLARIDDAPFALLFSGAIPFWRSQILGCEWLEAQNRTMS